MIFRKLTILTLILSALAFATTPTDYSIDSNWSVKSVDISHDIDVFFVHPTTYSPPSNGKLNAELSNKELNKRTDGAISRQAGAFAGTTNLFAPRYRQMNMEVLGMSQKEIDTHLQMPIADIKAAFTYYIENLNNGRPFILASHSQGSNVLQSLLLDNPKMLDRDKLVAAYLIGWSFTDEQIKKIGIELSTKANQTGCLITWNTVGSGGKSPTLKEGARCVNPLSWTTDNTKYPATMNKCARIMLNDGTYKNVKNFTSAFINSYGGLEISKPNADIMKELTMNMGPECYHPYDYDFFYQNIVENAILRCEEYRRKHQ